MKKILLSIVAASMTLAACNAQSGFKVTGNVQGIQVPKAALVTFADNTALSNSPVKWTESPRLISFSPVNKAVFRLCLKTQTSR